MANPFTGAGKGFFEGINKQIEVNREEEEAWDSVNAKIFANNLKDFNSMKKDAQEKLEEEKALAWSISGDENDPAARATARSVIRANKYTKLDETTIQAMYRAAKSGKIPTPAAAPPPPMPNEQVPAPTERTSAMDKPAGMTEPGTISADVLIPPGEEVPVDPAAPELSAFDPSKVPAEEGTQVAEAPIDSLESIPEPEAPRGVPVEESDTPLAKTIQEEKKSRGIGERIGSFMKNIMGGRTKEQREIQIVEKLAQAYDLTPEEVRAIRGSSIYSEPESTYEKSNPVDFRQLEREKKKEENVDRIEQIRAEVKAREEMKGNDYENAMSKVAQYAVSTGKSIEDVEKEIISKPITRELLDNSGLTFSDIAQIKAKYKKAKVDPYEMLDDEEDIEAPKGKTLPTYKDAAEVTAAYKAGKVKDGDEVMVGGKPFRIGK